MTFEEKVVDLLVSRGFFEDPAQDVLEMVKADTATEAMRGRWRDDVEGYPDTVLAVLWAGVRVHALDWIDQNLPKAWFRPLFSEKKNENNRLDRLD